MFGARGPNHLVKSILKSTFYDDFDQVYPNGPWQIKALEN